MSVPLPRASLQGHSRPQVPGSVPEPILLDQTVQPTTPRKAETTLCCAHSFIQHNALRTYYVQGPVLDTGVVAVNNTETP